MRFVWLLLLGIVVSPLCAEAAPSGAWSDVPPAASGWSEAGLAEAKAFSDAHHVTALMVVQHGAVVAAWGDIAKPTELASVRKSLLDALIGIAVSRRQISLDSTLGQLGIDDVAPALSADEKQATVRMLLEARSGVYHPALYETKAMAAKRPPRFSHPPGSFWYYNNWDFNVLGSIYERATGASIYQSFAQDIARPIGMQDYDPGSQKYVRGAASQHPAYTFRMSARDLARFAQLFLDGGQWNGRQIVPADWVRDSTTPHSDADRGLGYGYLWWTADATTASANVLGLPQGAYFARGHGGQFAFVIPRDDLVIVERTDRDLHLSPPTIHDVATLVRLIRQAGHLDAVEAAPASARQP
ncbi:serine hydrolase domain-containing protein [Bradyrhizobium sp. 2TAF24]|uniref:serine hydrolase domain-containing protein n=1 Tax=Bradyrhizobium sp. 2TAF24 TaxID=3233011 RepID=UPI003F9075A6